MRDDLIERLKALPENVPLPFYEESALVNYILADSDDGEELILALAEYSLPRAQAVLAQIKPLLGRYDVRSCERIIAHYEEVREAREVASLTQDEIEARLALQALLPPDSPEAKRMKRVLTRVLVRRDPVSAVAQLESAHPHNDDYDYDFHRSLLRELFWYFHNTNPSIAFRCLKEGQDARRWLATLLAQPDTPEELCLEVLDHIITLTTGSVFNEYEGHVITTQIARSLVPYRLALFARLVEHTERLPATLRFLMIERIVRAAHALSRAERRTLGSTLSQEALPHLTPQERRKAERLLYREKFVQ